MTAAGPGWASALAVEQAVTVAAPESATPPADEPIVLSGGWPDDELFVIDYLAAHLRRLDGELLGGASVDTETWAWDNDAPPEFVRVGAQPERGGIRDDDTSVSVVLVEVYGPTRRAVKNLASQVTTLMLALDRGGEHRTILVDACYLTAGDAPEPDRDEDDRRRSQMWALEWRPHWGDAVFPVPLPE